MRLRDEENVETQRENAAYCATSCDLPAPLNQSQSLTLEGGQATFTGELSALGRSAREVYDNKNARGTDFSEKKSRFTQGLFDRMCIRRASH